MSLINWMDAVDGTHQILRRGPRLELVAVNAPLTRLTATGAELFTDDALPGLRELLLSGSHFATSALDAAVAATLVGAGGSERLAVNATALDAEILLRLLAVLGPLHVLDLAGTALNADAIRAVIGRQPGLADLRLGMAPQNGYEHRFTPILKGGEVLDAVGALTGLEGLSLRGLEIGDEAAELATLVGLARLDLGETRASDVTARSVARNPALRELRVDGTRIGDDGLAALATHGGLALLDISDTRVTPTGTLRLAGQRQLRQLSLRGLALSDTQANLFSGLTGLQMLDLSQTRVGPRVVEALAAARALTTLKLPGITPDTVRACAGLHGLRSLSCGVSDPPWGELARLDALQDLAAPLDEAAQLPPNLRRLDTGGIDATIVLRLTHATRLETLRMSVGADQLAKLPATALPEFRELMASGGDLTDTALRRLLAAPAMEALYISDSAITPYGLQALTEARFIHTLELRNIRLDRPTAELLARLERLHCLDVPGTGLGDAELALLAQAPNLQSLALDPGQITARSMAALAIAPISELYIYGSPVPPTALGHLRALTGLQELKIVDELIEAEHVQVIALLPSLRLVQGTFASRQVAGRLATMRPDLRGFRGAGQGTTTRRGRTFA